MTVSSRDEQAATLRELGPGATSLATDLDWLAAELGALYLHDDRGRITSRHDHVRSSAPRFHLGRTRHGSLWRMRADLEPPLVRRLSRLAARERTPAGDTFVWPQPERLFDLRRALEDAAPVTASFRGPVYRLPPAAAALGAIDARCLGAEGLDPARTRAVDELRDALPDVFAQAADVTGRAPIVVSRDTDGRIAAACYVASGDPTRFVEAGVDTRPELRRRGHAARAVAGWLVAIRRLGGTPFYSAHADNAASRGVARSLGLDAFADIAHWS